MPFNLSCWWSNITLMNKLLPLLHLDLILFCRYQPRHIIEIYTSVYQTNMRLHGNGSCLFTMVFIFANALELRLSCTNHRYAHTVMLNPVPLKCSSSARLRMISEFAATHLETIRDSLSSQLAKLSNSTAFEVTTCMNDYILQNHMNVVPHPYPHFG